MIGKGLSTAVNNILYTDRGRFILSIIYDNTKQSLHFVIENKKTPYFSRPIQ